MSILARHAEKEKELSKRMLQLHIFPKDIKESFVRSSGPGGQNVNKVATCVVLQHLPSGLKVKCQSERTQKLNRYKAKRLLVDKIEQMIHEEKLRKIQKYEKRKRQNRKRPKSLKEEILQTKHYQSEKKASRRKITTDKLDDY